MLVPEGEAMRKITKAEIEAAAKAIAGKRWEESGGRVDPNYYAPFFIYAKAALVAAERVRAKRGGKR